MSIPRFCPVSGHFHPFPPRFGYFYTGTLVSPSRTVVRRSWTVVSRSRTVNGLEGTINSPSRTINGLERTVNSPSRTVNGMERTVVCWERFPARPSPREPFWGRLQPAGNVLADGHQRAWLRQQRNHGRSFTHFPPTTVKLPLRLPMLECGRRLPGSNPWWCPAR